MDLRTQSGSSPIVIECVLKMIEQAAGGGMVTRGMHIIDDRVFVMPADVLMFYRSNTTGGTDKMTGRSLQNVLRSLSSRQHAKAFVLRGKEQHGAVCWIELDTDLLIEVARREGWPCGQLTTILRNRDEKKKKGLLLDDDSAIVSVT